MVLQQIVGLEPLLGPYSARLATHYTKATRSGKFKGQPYASWIRNTWYRGVVDAVQHPRAGMVAARHFLRLDAAVRGLLSSLGEVRAMEQLFEAAHAEAVAAGRDA